MRFATMFNFRISLDNEEIEKKEKVDDNNKSD